MNTKEAIEFCEKIKANANPILGRNIIIDLLSQEINNIRWNMPHIIALLQRGENNEKFKQMYLWSAGLNEKLKEDIKRLKQKAERGEKYEAMWKELRKDYGEYTIDCEHMNSVKLEEVIDKIKQKYFPKPSDNFTEKVMGKINEKGEA